MDFYSFFQGEKKRMLVKVIYSVISVIIITEFFPFHCVII